MAAIYGAQRLVLQAIYDLPKDDAGFVTDSQIAKRSRISLEDVRNWIETLEREGLIEVARTTEGLSVLLTALCKLALKQSKPFGPLSTGPQTVQDTSRTGYPPAVQSTLPSPGNVKTGQDSGPGSPCTSIVSSQRIIPSFLIVDDDVSEGDEIYSQLRLMFFHRASVELWSDPQSACARLSTEPAVIGCLTDIVFRSHSSLSGVVVAETAIRHGIIPVVMTGHDVSHLGVAMRELRVIGVPADRILSKPITIDQHRAFFNKIKETFYV